MNAHETRTATVVIAHSTMQGPLAAVIRWSYTCPCTLNVGIQPSSLHFRVAPNDVILPHDVRQKNPSSRRELQRASGLGAAGSGGRTTLPLAQHIPICSFWNFRAWQCWHSTDMDTIKSAWSAE